MRGETLMKAEEVQLGSLGTTCTPELCTFARPRRNMGQIHVQKWIRQPRKPPIYVGLQP